VRSAQGVIRWNSDNAHTGRAAARFLFDCLTNSLSDLLRSLAFGFNGNVLEKRDMAGIFDFPNLDIPYHYPTANYSRLDE
jgi:hypothetical protein